MNRLKLILVFIFLLLINVFFFDLLTNKSQQEAKINEIVKRITTQTEASKQKRDVLLLLDKVGVEETQELLYASGLPFTGESHLLVHTVGEYIYKNLYGQLSLCKDYFLSACYHAYIISDLADHGLDGVGKTVSECEKSGPTVLSQCSHAAGHGFLAWTDYDLPKALELCDEINQSFPNIPTFNCYDGVFMENIYGVHDGEPSPKRWINESDDFYPCNDPKISQKYQAGCWANQATMIYLRYSDFEKVAKVCDSVNEDSLKTMCYNNFARQIHPVTLGQTEKGFELCKLATEKKWQNYCLISLSNAAYSVGDRVFMPYQICNTISDDAKDQCYLELSSAIKAYSRSTDEKRIQCEKIMDNKYVETCKKY